MKTKAVNKIILSAKQNLGKKKMLKRDGVCFTMTRVQNTNKID